MNGSTLITLERERQIEIGRSLEKDDLQIDGEILDCAIFICSDIPGAFGIGTSEDDEDDPDSGWPAQRAAHVKRKYGDDIIRRLTIAGALIAAEIDRLSRIPKSSP